jgi:hypothetical protein
MSLRVSFLRADAARIASGDAAWWSGERREATAPS